jgi:hypothetical protein
VTTTDALFALKVQRKRVTILLDRIISGSAVIAAILAISAMGAIGHEIPAPLVLRADKVIE